MAAPRGRRGRHRHHGLRAGRPRRRRVRRAPSDGHGADRRANLRRGRVEQERVRPVRSGRRARRRGERRAEGQARGGEPRPVRRGLDDPHRGHGARRGREAPRRGSIPDPRTGRAVAVNPYAPHTPAEIAAMLQAIGVEALDDLVAQVPAGLRERAGIELPPGLTEPELRERFAALARRNAGDGVAVFLGAGAYPHDASAVVNQIRLRSEFAPAYTPYQPEVSQRALQAISDFQPFTALLLGLAVANASMYDGASATAEAVLMARRLLPQRRRVLVARALHPHYRAAIQTYVSGLGEVEIREVPFAEDGRTDLHALQGVLDGDTLCVVLGQPNVFGVVEDLAAAAPLVQAAGALLVSATTEAVALGLLRSPGACGVDVAVAEGQSFGLPVSYGGPGVGMFAARELYVRAMPGRIVGETVDGTGRRGYVLTLATREQHIRRERATSNICTNQGLCALAVTVHLAMLGRSGLARLARVNYRAAHDAARRLEAAGVTQRFAAPFFNEFVVRVPDAEGRWDALAQPDGVVAGYPLGRWYPELADTLLVWWTAPRRRRRAGRLVAALAGGARARRGGVGEGGLLDEPLIFERGSTGRSGWQVPGDDDCDLPSALCRDDALAGFPEVGELEVLRHFVRLSQWNYSAATTFYPLGSCTMKYNPPGNEELARLPGFAQLHPLVPSALAQGALALCETLERALMAVSGLDAVTLQPAAGAQGELLGMLLVRAYHGDRGNVRRRVLIPASA